MPHSHSEPPSHTKSPTSTGRVQRSYPSAELIQYTIRVWEPRLGRKLTEEDARQILENVVGFFRVLLDWDRKDRQTQRRLDHEQD